MLAILKKEFFPYHFREVIAKKEVDYHITNQLNGKIVISQDGCLGHNVSSMENVKFDVKIHDPSGTKLKKFEIP